MLSILQLCCTALLNRRRCMCIAAHGSLAHCMSTLVSHLINVAACRITLSLQVLHSFEAHSDRVTRLSCQGDTILSCSFDGNCRLWQF